MNIIEELQKEFPNKNFYKKEINDLCYHIYLDNTFLSEYIPITGLSLKFFSVEQKQRLEQETLNKIIEQIKSLDKN